MSALVNFEPVHSQLGIIQIRHEQIDNAKGNLAVMFRYNKVDIKNLEMGLQIQFESISSGSTRGDHYHYPSFAAEEFFIISGNAVLIVSDIDRKFIEIYNLKKGTTYFVPGLVAHKVQNISQVLGNDEEVILVISKHYNYHIKNLQKVFIIDFLFEKYHLNNINIDK